MPRSAVIDTRMVTTGRGANSLKRLFAGNLVLTHAQKISPFEKNQNQQTSPPRAGFRLSGADYYTVQTQYQWRHSAGMEQQMKKPATF